MRTASFCAQLLLAACSWVFLGGLALAASPDAAPQVTPAEILQKETVSDADYKALQRSMKLPDEQFAQLKQQLEIVRKVQEAERKAWAKLEQDPRAKPTHVLWKALRLERKAAGDEATNFCLSAQGRLLVCCGARNDRPDAAGSKRESSAARGIHVLSPDGQTEAVWPLAFTPQAICTAPDGAVFAAGNGRMAKLDAWGKTLAGADIPQLAERKKALEKPAAQPGKGDDKKQTAAAIADVDADDEKPAVSLLDALWGALTGKPAVPDEDAKRRALERARFEAWRHSQVAGLAASDKDLFVCCPGSGGFTVYRVDHAFGQPKKIITGLAGCCGQQDIHVRGEELFVAENGRFRISRYDRDGKLQSSWGRGERVGVEGFSGCCNPKNIHFGSGDVIYTSESGPPQRIKRHALDGRFLDVVAIPKFRGGCVRTTVAVSADGSRVYVLDTSENQIHAFVDRRTMPTHKQVRAIDLRSMSEGANVRTFCFDGKDRLLVGMGGRSYRYARQADGRIEAKSVDQPCRIKLLDLDGKAVGQWPLEVTPQAIAAADDAIYVGGAGRLARLDRQGHTLQAIEAPNLAENRKALEEHLARRAEEARVDAERAAAAKTADQGKADAKLKTGEQGAEKPPPFDLAAERQKLLAALTQRSTVTAIAVTQRELFVACAGRMGFDVYRMDRDFGNPKKVIERLVGCCGQMDIQAHGERIYAAENVRKQVGCYDRDGRRLFAWGKPERGDVEGFGSCCNPMNTRFGPGGELFTCESGLGRVKRFSPDGKFLGVVGTAAVGPGCKHVPLAIAPDGKRVFVLNPSDAQLALLEPDASIPPRVTEDSRSLLELSHAH